MRTLNDAAAQAGRPGDDTREMVLLLIAVLTFAYRLGRYGVAEGDDLSDDERVESINKMKPLALMALNQINQMGRHFYE